MKIHPKYLRLTEETNSLDYLEHAVASVYKTEKSKISWKWVVIGLHGAVYGFAICACQGTNPDIVTKKNGKLIDFDEALKKCKDPNWMGVTGGGQPLILSPSQERSLKILKNTLRNNFQHYKPMGWSIEIHGMPTIAIDVLEVIRHLALNTRTAIHLRSVDKKRTRSLVFQATKFLKRSRLYREALLLAGP